MPDAAKGNNKRQNECIIIHDTLFSSTPFISSLESKSSVRSCRPSSAFSNLEANQPILIKF